MMKFNTNGKKKKPRKLEDENVFECDSGFVFEPFECYVRKFMAKERERQGLRKKYDPCCYCPMVRKWLEQNPNKEKEFKYMPKPLSLKQKVLKDIEEYDIHQKLDGKKEETKKKSSAKKSPTKASTKKVSSKRALDLSDGKYAVRPSIEPKEAPKEEIKKEPEIKRETKPIITMNDFDKLEMAIKLDNLKLRKDQLDLEMIVINKHIAEFEKLLNLK